MRVVVVGGGVQLEGDRRVFTRVTAMLYALYLVGNIGYMGAYICQTQSTLKTTAFYLKIY